MKNFFTLVVLLICFVSCVNEHNNRVYNLDDKEQSEKAKQLKLDDAYANLLNPQVSKDEFKAVYGSWSDFHKEIGEYIKQENFNWGVADSTITLVNKIYFDKEGKVEHFLFKVWNEKVSNDKKAEYQLLLNKFIENSGVNLKRDKQFAQCGKVKYINY